MSSGLYPVLFRYPAGTPGPVALVASFNHWDPSAHQLRRVGQGWRITVYLPAGTYPYAFVREGQFVKDPDPLRSAASARYSVLSIGDHPKPAGLSSRGAWPRIALRALVRTRSLVEAGFVVFVAAVAFAVRVAAGGLPRNARGARPPEPSGRRPREGWGVRSAAGAPARTP